MGEAKQIVHRYNGDTRKDEVELDQDGEWGINDLDGTRGGRKGKAWKVEDTLLTLLRRPTELPILTVFLTDML
jgi:hypothetical protein